MSRRAPEQTLGLPVDARVDVYAAGVLLFELLADKKPFSNANPIMTMQGTVRRRYPRSTTSRPSAASRRRSRAW